MKNKTIIIILSLIHLFCDLICGFKIVGILGNNYIEQSVYIFLLYNMIAFCLQPIAGLVVDKYHNEKEMLVFSFILILFGALINNLTIFCVLLGIGNQIFHVAGGKICTNISTNKASHLGLFVCLGTIGIMIGSNFYQYNLIYTISILIYLILLILVLPLIENKEIVLEQTPNQNKKIIWLFLIIIVFIRSFVGKIIHYDFTINLTIIVILAIACATGKFIGGILRDKFGSFKVIFITMILAGVILIFFDNVIFLMIIGTMLINISMPITLYELNKINKSHEGLNFGILAAVLFPGVALGLIYEYKQISYIILITICLILSIYGIYFTTKENN